MPRTRRADPNKPGIARRRRGRGFGYTRPNGRPVRDDTTLARIDALAIPPAWTDVWISPDPLGHIQATGTDAAGRRQYRYHDVWRTRRDAAKFDDMVAFAEALPRVRRRVARDLRRPELDLERAAAGAVRLLDIGFFRIGSEQYATDNGSFGLTTLRRDHVHVEDGTIVFDYVAKSGKRRVQQIADPASVELVSTLKRRRGGGPELLAHKRDGRWHNLDADAVNTYLKDVSGGAFSAKDFRTFNATALCAVVLARRAQDVTSKASRTRVVNAAVKEVAAYLGNTPAVCRRSYIDPRVIDRFESGLTIVHALADKAAPDADMIDQRSIGERVRVAVLDLIAGDRHADDVERIAA